jgi:1,2-diacylglycerol 3-beta-glucosyltransferase
MNGDGILFGVGAAQALALIMSVTFITYVLIIVIPFLRYRPKPPGDSAVFDWHFFVPARDEEKVIGETLTYLRATFPAAHIWVADDASTDATARILTEHAERDDHVHPVFRTAPNARTGKGDALNSIYDALHAWLPATADRDRLIVGVVDADGRPAANCLDVCAADHLFGTEAVGSVQVCVRMLNRYDSRPFPARGRLVNAAGHVLVRLQDLEFRAAIAAIQSTRRRTRTVGLGGNGQFSRLQALDDVRTAFGRPWHGALLEDYELSLHLLLTGHRNEYTDDTLVDQEGLPNFRRLLTQRTRWGQGTMQCGSYLTRLWSSRNVPTIGALEAGYYLLQPWLQLLGSLVYPVPAAVLIYTFAHQPALMTGWFTGGGWLLVVLYVVLGLGPFVAWGPIYVRRCEPRLGLLRGIGLGLAYAAFMGTFYITSWRAFIRIVRGRHDWAKTRRNAEFIPDSAAG